MTSEAIVMAVSESIDVKTKIRDDTRMHAVIQAVADKCIQAFRHGNRVMLAGNGGSAADAQHIAAEFVGRYAFDRPGLPAIALSTDTSMLTAIGNDYGYEHVFRRQIDANGSKGDVFIGISTSGKSANIIAALERARELEITTVGLTGRSGANMRELCDYCIEVPSDSTPRIQESHIMIGHIICGIAEQTLYGKKDER